MSDADTFAHMDMAHDLEDSGVLPLTSLGQHTPGPWDFFIGNTNGRGLIRIEASIDSPAAGTHIASLARGKISEENARLIAVAPELLKAAINYLEAWNAPGSQRQEAIDIATGKLAEIVIKAEGRA